MFLTNLKTYTEKFIFYPFKTPNDYEIFFFRVYIFVRDRSGEGIIKTVAARWRQNREKKLTFSHVKKSRIPIHTEGRRAIGGGGA